MTNFNFLNVKPGTLPFRKELMARLKSLSSPPIIVAFSLAEISGLHEKNQGRCILVIATRGLIGFGPLYCPEQSLCFDCLHHWLGTAYEGRDFAIDFPGIAEATAVADLIKETFKAGDLNEASRFTFQSFDLLTRKHVIHPIFPLRDCRRCSQNKLAERSGLRVHCSSLTGIVQSMELTKNRVAGAYRAVGIWKSPLPVGNTRALLSPQRSHGRGRTREEAEQGCIGEALERYSLIYRGDEPLVYASLAKSSGVDPRNILLYSERQYESREEWNRSTDERYFVGERFDPEEKIDWFPGVDLADGSCKLLPAASVLMWYPFRAGAKEYVRSDSIGCASGWTLHEALAHALLEWIERDAMAVWWYNRICRPAVNLESFDMRELLDVREDFSRNGRNFFLLDCTHDFGIPTYISVAPRKDGTEVLFAGASHISPRIAAWKAASEVGQIWFSAMHRRAIDPEIKSWLAKSIDKETYLLPICEIDAPPEPLAMSSRELVMNIVDRFRAAGLQAYAADLSRSDVILKTARAVVPGLRHIWNRRGPGRLYDVPVRLKWLNHPLEEGQLNSICCMI